MVVSSEKLRWAFHHNGCVGAADMYFYDVLCLFNLAYRSHFMFVAKIFASFAITCLLRSKCEYIFAISSTCEANANKSWRVQIMRNEAKRNKANANNSRQIFARLKQRPTPVQHHVSQTKIKHQEHH